MNKKIVLSTLFMFLFMSFAAHAHVQERTLNDISALERIFTVDVDQVREKCPNFKNMRAKSTKCFVAVTPSIEQEAFLKGQTRVVRLNDFDSRNSIYITFTSRENGYWVDLSMSVYTQPKETVMGYVKKALQKAGAPIELKSKVLVVR